MNIAESLANTPVTNLDLSRFVAVAPTDSVVATVEAMNNASRSSACVVADGKLLGVFTQRDFLMRIVGRRSLWDHPIADEMTSTVRTMTTEMTAADGLGIMNEWWIRNVPVLDDDSKLYGSLSFYELMAKIADLVAEHIDDEDTSPAARHSLTLIDFTGLNTSTPVVVSAEDTVEVAAHHMRARAIGSVMVTDDSERLVGVVTEFDLQRRIGCTIEDLASVKVRDIMTPDPVSLAVRSPIVSAIRQMATRGFSHLPLLGETGRPVAVASFRDIAGYMEASFAALS